jgi:hypothetical protein
MTNRGNKTQKVQEAKPDERVGNHGGAFQFFVAAVYDRRTNTAWRSSAVIDRRYRCRN